MNDRIEPGWSECQPGGENWETVLQQMPVGVMLVGASDGRPIFRNAAARALWGDAPAPEEWPVWRTLRTGDVVTGEDVDVVRRNGARGVLSMSASALRDEGGAITAAVVTFTDVTQARRRDAARRFLHQASAVLSSSLEYTETLGNVARLAVPSLADWCAVDIVDGAELHRLAVEHVDPEKAAIAAMLGRRFPPKLESQNGVARVLRTGRPTLIGSVTEETLRSVAQDDEHLDVLRALELKSVMVVPLVARGRILGGITLAASESARRFDAEDLALAEELALLAARAIDNARLYHESEAANQAKVDFLSVVSHELRTPLTAVIGYSELLSLGIPEPLTARQGEQLERIEIAANHLLQLIDQILTIANLEAGTISMVPREVRLAAILQRAEAIARPLAREKRLEMTIEAPDPDVVLTTDPDRLLQVFINLLSNAVKFTESGSIQVRASRLGDAVEVTVRDTGIGIEPGTIARIFEPFRQIESPTTRRSGGTGLGLTISRRLLELLGGEIEVESTPGEGSTFTVRLPVGSD
jgi:signal transduction histidine kinase